MCAVSTLIKTRVLIRDVNEGGGGVEETSPRPPGQHTTDPQQIDSDGGFTGIRDDLEGIKTPTARRRYHGHC